MKLKLMTAIAFSAMAIISCDEDTATIGNSLTVNGDKLSVATQTFGITTRSVAVDSVFSSERQCYFGKVIDPETDAYVKSEFTSQFNMMETSVSDLPDKEDIVSRDADGNIIADSCVIRVFLDVASSYGDTLAAMKLRVSELDKPIEGNGYHYSNFDPKARGYISDTGFKKSQMFSMRDLTISDSIRYLTDTNLHRSSTGNSDNGYYDLLRIRLNEPYTDKKGVTYNNYGTYILRNFFDHPEYFKNSYSFIHNVCPGFLFETIDGLGVMARIMELDMLTYFRFKLDTLVATDYLATSSTEEVVQTTNVTNDSRVINQLVNDESCTYLKSPAGIFTEVTLPVEEICTSHPNDSLLTAKVIFHRLNNTTEASELSFAPPSKVLLIEKDSLENFFQKNKLYNNTYAFEQSLLNNAYTFSNISNIITRMYNAKADGIIKDPNWIEKHPNWNKALLLPIDEITVTNTATSYYYSTTTSNSAVGLKNKMGLSSTRLVRGTAANPIKIEVIYAKFND